MKTITVTITPTGETKIEASGFAGKGCKAATQDLEKALGMVSDTTKKPEFDRLNQLSQGT